MFLARNNTAPFRLSRIALPYNSASSSPPSTQVLFTESTHRSTSLRHLHNSVCRHQLPSTSQPNPYLFFIIGQSIKARAPIRSLSKSQWGGLHSRPSTPQTAPDGIQSQTHARRQHHRARIPYDGTHRLVMSLTEGMSTMESSGMGVSVGDHSRTTCSLEVHTCKMQPVKLISNSTSKTFDS